MKGKAIWLLAGLLVGSALGSAQTDPGVSETRVLQLRYVTILVKNYDEALAWYTSVLGLKKVEDRSFGPGQRWLVVAPEGQRQMGIVLDVPHSAISSPERMGKETDWVFVVADCQKFYETLSARGVHFIERPKQQPWGDTQAIFEDPYGNIFVAESQGAAGDRKQSGGQ